MALKPEACPGASGGCQRTWTPGEGTWTGAASSLCGPAWKLGLGDADGDGQCEGGGCGGREGESGQPPTRQQGQSLSMQVLQIVRELVSPSRRRAAARYGVCARVGVHADVRVCV